MYDYRRPIKIKDLKVGQWFTLKHIEYPTGSQVYIRGKYDRSERKYECGRFDDHSYSRMLSGDRIAYLDFLF